MTEQSVIRRAEVERRTSLSKALMYRLLHAGEFRCFRNQVLAAAA